jgi:tetratricopeptide (TPR) repeat protein
MRTQTAKALRRKCEMLLQDVEVQLLKETERLYRKTEQVAYCEQLLESVAAPTIMPAAPANDLVDDTSELPDDVDRDLCDLARAMEDRGDLDTAILLTQRLLSRESLPNNHPRVISAKRKLASLLHDTGDLLAAEPLYREVLRTRCLQLGVQHPQTLGSSIDLAMVLRDQGKLQDAEPLLRAAMHSQLAVLGKEHCDVLCTIGNLADLLRESGQLDEAKRIFGDAAEAAARTLGGRHMTTLVLSAKKARLVHAVGSSFGEHVPSAMGLMRAAEEQLNKTVSTMRSALGVRHPQTLKYTEVLSQWGC